MCCELKVMLPLFCQFLVVRVFERIQALSVEKCGGCVKNYRFSSLHACVKTTLPDRIDMFLPQAKSEAFEKMERLIVLFQQSFNLLQNKEAYLQIGRSFLENLQPKQVLDRRFINEDTEEMFQYDDSWVTFEEDLLSSLCREVLNVEDSDDAASPTPRVPKIRKRKAMQILSDVDETEIIADRPVKKCRNSWPKKPKAPKD